MMTRKDYIATANILRTAIADANATHGENSKDAFFAIESVMYVAEMFSEYFQSDNERFDEARFFQEVTK